MKIHNLIRHALIAGAIMVSLASCSKRPVSQGFDWPRWRGSNGDGVSKESDWNPKVLTGGPKILWKVNIGEGYSNVVIENNRLYTMGKTFDKKGAKNTT